MSSLTSRIDSKLLQTVKILPETQNYLELRIEYECMGIDNRGHYFMQPR